MDFTQSSITQRCQYSTGIGAVNAAAGVCGPFGTEFTTFSLNVHVPAFSPRLPPVFSTKKKPLSSQKYVTISGAGHVDPVNGVTLRPPYRIRTVLKESQRPFPFAHPAMDDT